MKQHPVFSTVSSSEPVMGPGVYVGTGDSRPRKEAVVSMQDQAQGASSIGRNSQTSLSVHLRGQQLGLLLHIFLLASVGWTSSFSFCFWGDHHSHLGSMASRRAYRL
jgi:hypothetical protein